jgi:LemA protein
MMLNTKIATFPANIVAGMFGFRDRQYFELANAGHREMPDVSFTARRPPAGA